MVYILLRNYLLCLISIIVLFIILSGVIVSNDYNYLILIGYDWNLGGFIVGALFSLAVMKPMQQNNILRISQLVGLILLIVYFTICFSILIA